MTTSINPVQVVPGAADATIPNQMGVADYSGKLVGNPSNFFTTDNPSTSNVNESMFLQNQVPSLNADAVGTNINGQDQKYSMNPHGLQQNAATVGNNVAQVGQVAGKQANTYDVEKTYDKIVDPRNQMQAAKGTVSDNALIKDAPQSDIEATAAGKNGLGQALNAHASQNMSNVIDTSTAAGKLLAQSLGEGNYLDSKATMLGQMEILSKEFVDADGNPKIPTWAAGTARAVGKIAAFGGLTGSAQTSIMAQALLEASLPMAQADAQFYQTLTIKNLDNKQQSTINKANVLAKMEQANLDNRMAAAVQNSQFFMQMDLANLSNEQQARVINTQNRVQSILEDAKQTNAQRLFTAQSQNEMDMFYDNLNTQIQQYNATQTNQMRMFDTDQINSMKQFNVQMENNRQQFYQTMQYNIDTANAKWRQTITLTDAQMKFEAAATDVKNMVGISVEQLNQLWDRSDALLDYVWKSSESDLDRKNRILEVVTNNQGQLMNTQAQANAQESAANSAGVGSIVGTIASGVVGSKWFDSKLTKWF